MWQPCWATRCVSRIRLSFICRLIYIIHPPSCPWGSFPEPLTLGWCLLGVLPQGPVLRLLLMTVWTVIVLTYRPVLLTRVSSWGQGLHLCGFSVASTGPGTHSALNKYILNQIECPVGWHERNSREPCAYSLTWRKNFNFIHSTDFFRKSMELNRVFTLFWSLFDGIYFVNNFTDCFLFLSYDGNHSSNLSVKQQASRKILFLVQNFI